MTVPLAAPPRSMIGAPTRRRGTATARVRSATAARAYARRAQRTGTQSPAQLSVDREIGVATSRTPFVVLVMMLLSVTLVATLWLSTAAAADSYRLQGAREVARDLTERSEQLGREVATLETAPELARRATRLGMVPAGDPARLTVAPDGAVVVVSEHEPATTIPAPQSAPAPLSTPVLPASASGA